MSKTKFVDAFCDRPYDIIVKDSDGNYSYCLSTVDKEIAINEATIYLKTYKQCSFKQHLEKQHSKMEVIVTFMLILELMIVGQITIKQDHLFDDILITAIQSDIQ